MLVASLSMWVFGFVTAGDTCKVSGTQIERLSDGCNILTLHKLITQRISKRFIDAVEPSEREVLIKMFTWLGIDHYKLE